MKTPLTPEQIETVTTKIINAISGRAFEHWYNKGRFDTWISGDDKLRVTEMGIKDDIKHIFRLTEQ